MSRAERGLSWLAAAVVVAIIWVVTARAGAVGIARADDWAYLFSQFHLARTGEFALNNWAVTMLIGQTLVALPIVAVFGESIVALQAFVALTGFVALPLVYALLRRFLPTWPSAVAVATLALGPIFGPSLISFMTDVPALLLLTLALFAGLRALRDDGVSAGWLIASAMLGVAAFTFRDYAIVSFVAVFAVALVRVRRDQQTRITVIVVAAAAFGVALLLYRWRHGLAYDLKLDGWDFTTSMTLVARALLTAALFVSPALLLVSPTRVWSSLRTVGRWTALVIALVTALVAGIARMELLGNVVHPYGGTWLVAGSGVRMWPLAVNRLVLVVSVLAFAYLVAVAIVFIAWLLRRVSAEGSWAFIDRQSGVLGGRLVVLLYPVLLLGAHIAATSVLGTWLIDRYFILLVPFLAGAVLIGTDVAGLRTASGWRAVAPVGLAAYAVLGLHVVDFDATTEGARWRLAEQLVGEGADPASVDGGLQWVSFHETAPGLPAQVVPTRPGRTWWTERYPDRLICQTIVAVDAGGDVPAAATSVKEVRTILGRSFSLAVVPGPDSCPDSL